MNLTIDDADRTLLQRLLERALGDLRYEISNTDSYDYRQGLHADEDRLKAIIAKLESAA